MGSLSYIFQRRFFQVYQCVSVFMGILNGVVVGIGTSAGALQFGK